MRDYARYRKWKSTAMSVAAILCALLVVAPLLLVLVHLVREGSSAINWDFLTKLPASVGENGGGMANAIIGTFVLLGLALVLGVPIGVLGGIYLSEFGDGRVNFWIRF